MCAQLSAIAVKEKTIFERLYLVLGFRKIALCVSCPCEPTTPTIYPTTISRFLSNFCPEWPLIFCVHDLIWPGPGALFVTGFFQWTISNFLSIGTANPTWGFSKAQSSKLECLFATFQ